MRCLERISDSHDCDEWSEEILESRRIVKVVTAITTSGGSCNYQLTRIWPWVRSYRTKSSREFKDIRKHEFTEFKDRTWELKEK